jgi:hypothetical protein
MPLHFLHFLHFDENQGANLRFETAKMQRVQRVQGLYLISALLIPAVIEVFEVCRVLTQPVFDSALRYIQTCTYAYRFSGSERAR